MLKGPNKLTENENALFTGVTLWEGIGGGRLLNGVLHNKSQKLLKEVNQTNFQK